MYLKNRVLCKLFCGLAIRIDVFLFKADQLHVSQFLEIKLDQYVQIPQCILHEIPTTICSKRENSGNSRFNSQIQRMSMYLSVYIWDPAYSIMVKILATSHL